jgi:hypothetical protein
LASGAERSARKRRFAAKVATGVAAAPHVSAFSDGEIHAETKRTISEQRTQLKQHRRATDPEWAFRAGQVTKPPTFSAERPRPEWVGELGQLIGASR